MIRTALAILAASTIAAAVTLPTATSTITATTLNRGTHFYFFSSKSMGFASSSSIMLNDADVVAHVASLVHGSLVFTKATAGVIDITQRDSAISLYTEKRRGVRLVGSAVSEPPPLTLPSP